jgi:hypothetical protein
MGCSDGYRMFLIGNEHKALFKHSDASYVASSCELTHHSSHRFFYFLVKQIVLPISHAIQEECATFHPPTSELQYFCFILVGIPLTSNLNDCNEAMFLVCHDMPSTALVTSSIWQKSFRSLSLALKLVLTTMHARKSGTRLDVFKKFGVQPLFR